MCCNHRVVYYNSIVGHYTIVGVLRFHKLLGKNGKNTLKGKYQKEGIKYEGWVITPTHYDLLQMLIIFFIPSSPLVYISN